ncbi:MAG: LEA type 2 family protein [Pseudomonadota bacterium]|nr:LEA type 2 family protein [Pseudomonadota bacterium]MDO7666953.1 LEA type 2 family protein [Pseudomonadota bacterium]MDO7711048.1 LEA type 2 family protein [Pseudomonadota bacterium]
MTLFKCVSVVFLMIFLAACAGLTPNYEKPQVNVTSFTLAPNSSGLAPRFNIGLQIINPNRTALPLVGMSYSVEVEGNRILSGAEPNLPRIEGYSSADIVIQASPDLFGSARLLNQLFSGQRDELNYLFKARLDVGTLMPYINIEEEGSFGLTNGQ